MFEINDSNNTLLSADFNTESTLDVISPQSTSTSSSVFYDPGTLEADRFSLAPDYQLTVFSGKGNIEYGDGFYDTLDLSNISIDSVELGFAKNQEGYYYDVGDGRRAFDSVILADDRQILFEGVERIVFADRILDLAFNPDDPGFDIQWNLHTMGVHTAWNFTTGTDDILIGVQDSGLGIDAAGNIHPDIQADETWVLSDNFADDFFRESAFGSGKLQPNSHGTSVQGIISAETDNGVGIAGINWNSDVYNVDVIDGNIGDLNLVGATQSMIDLATSQGQKLIINMSLEGALSNSDFETLIANNQDDVLFVIAAGNGGEDRISDPVLSNPAIYAAEYDNVVAVGAVWGNTDEVGNPVVPGTLATYSNYGEGISVVGPTFVPTTNATSEGELIYRNFNGTSAAAPNVAGVASLVWSANSDLSATQIKEILSDTAYDLGTEGNDLVYGGGLVNADTAVRRAISVEPESTSSNFNFSTIPFFSDTTSSSSGASFLVSEENTAIPSTTSSDRVDDPKVQNSVIRESSNSKLPTSLFDYEAPELQQIAKLDGQLVQEDLFSSPLYQ